MRVIEQTVYTFEELSESAKENARDWFKDGMEYHWFNESMASVKAFCNEYGVKIHDYSIGVGGHSFIETIKGNGNFRGLKLSDVNRYNMPTGYCVDCYLWTTFYDEFKHTSNALGAFNTAIDAALKAIIADMEYQYTNESVDANILDNEYEFTVFGAVA